MTTATDTNPYANLTKSTTNDAATLAASRAKAAKQSALNQAQFLKLMTTQMTHQMPDKPMESGAFLTQMAQFGTVTGIQDLQQLFSDFTGSMSSNQALQASGLVGKSVSVPATQGVLASGGNISGDVNLTGSAQTLNIVIENSAGETIKTLELGSKAKGDIPFVWDGKKEDGSLAEAGIYKVKATANIDGKETQLATDIVSKVESISMVSGTSNLTVNLDGGAGSVDFNKVKKII